MNTTALLLAHVGHHHHSGIDAVIHFLSFPNHWGPIVCSLILLGYTAWKLRVGQPK